MLQQYVSVETLFNKLDRDFKDNDFSETDVIEWAGEALELIGAIPQYEEAIAFIEVKDYQANVPRGTQSIIQVARNTCWVPTDKCICPKDIIDELTDEESADIPVALDCHGTPINDYDLAYYRPYFDLQAEFGNFSGSTFGTKCFSPIRLADHTFFNSVVCTLTDTSIDQLYDSGCQDEYTLVAKGKVMRFSFKEGMVAVSYTRQCVDDDGYPMIPNHTSYLTAVTSYVRYMYEKNQFYKHRRASESRLAKAEQDWQWYCKQAGNLMLMPKGVDDHQSILEQRQYLLPRMNRYYGFFGNMSRPEGRKFNDPDRRNNFKTYFRGY